MAILKEQWDSLIFQFTHHSYFTAVLKYQNHDIEIRKRAVSPEKNSFIVFIDKEIKGAWYDPKSATFNPLVKLFWNHINHKILSTVEAEKAKKIHGKKEFEKRLAKYYERRHDHYVPEFTSLKKLINQFKKIEELELITEDFL